jgi:hypothetical protein
MHFGLFMSLLKFVENTIETHTSQDVTDLFGAANLLGFSILEKRFDDATIKGRINPLHDSPQLGEVSFSHSNTHAEDKTTLALLMAHYLLQAAEWGTLKPYTIDRFFLMELRKIKMLHQVVLATRLAIPATIIKQLDGLQFNSVSYTQQACLMPVFLASALHISGKGLFGIMNNVNIGLRFDDSRFKSLLCLGRS